MIDQNIKDILQRPLPPWAVKPHPTKTNMTAIHPMSVIDVLNEAFGVGEWEFKTEYIACNPYTQMVAVYQNGKKTGAMREREMFMSAVKGILIVPKHSIHIEQYGGSSNDDMGDALKGGATDALTKCASYLGVGAMIYKGQGNVEVPTEWTLDEALTHVSQSTDLADLTKRFKELSATMQKDGEVIARCTELKTNFTNNVS